MFLVSKNKKLTYPGYFYFLPTFFSLGYITLLFLNDLYSPVLFLAKSFAFQVSAILIILNSLIAVFFVRKSYFLTITVTLNILLAWVMASQYSTYSPDRQSSDGFRVTSFSALTRTRNGQDLNRFLSFDKPEILCLQEVILEDTESLGNYYDYIYQPDIDDLVIASIWPIEVIDTRSGMQTARVKTKQSEVLVTNVHMPKQYNQIGIQTSWQRLMEHMANIQEPAILCGDFNMTPYNSMYAYITSQLGYEDAHHKSRGLNFTFPHKQRRIAALGTQFRIDYIFTKGVKIGWSETFSLSDLSDHKAVTATLIEFKS